MKLSTIWHLLALATAAGLVAICYPEPTKKPELKQVVSTTLTKVPGVSEGIELYIDTKTIEDFVDSKSSVRHAVVVYYFTTPLVIRGKDVYYMQKDAFYACDDNLFLNGDIIFYDKAASQLFKGPTGVGVEKPEKDTNSEVEMKFICGSNVTKKSAPKSSIGPIKPLNHIYI